MTEDGGRTTEDRRIPDRAPRLHTWGRLAGMTASSRCHPGRGAQRRDPGPMYPGGRGMWIPARARSARLAGMTAEVRRLGPDDSQRRRYFFALRRPSSRYRSTITLVPTRVRL